MFESPSLSIRVELTCIGTATLYRPDRLDLMFDETLQSVIAQALSALSALNRPGASVMLPLPHLGGYVRNGRPWPPQPCPEGSFSAAYAWLHVEPEHLRVEVWDAYGDDQLQGLIDMSEQPALQKALRSRLAMGQQELLRQLLRLLNATLRNVDRKVDVATVATQALQGQQPAEPQGSRVRRDRSQP